MNCIAVAPGRAAPDVLTRGRHAVRNARRSPQTAGGARVGVHFKNASKRAATTGRNPQTGAEVKIPARKVPKFSAGKGLKDAVN